jgi:DNA modification methylase
VDQFDGSRSSSSADAKPQQLELTTVWSFPVRGDWATHRGDYPGNWAPQVPRNLILRYSQASDAVLDPFVGSGTTLIECKLLNRRGIGIDINPRALELARQRLSFSAKNRAEQEILVGDARQLPLESASVDLVCTHPPYADALRYSSGLVGDLSCISDIDLFIREMTNVASELWQVLRPRCYCAVQMGDIRRHQHIIPVGFLTMNVFMSVGFMLREIIIKIQHNCRSTGEWAVVESKEFLLLAHEYLFVFEKV